MFSAAMTTACEVILVKLAIQESFSSSQSQSFRGWGPETWGWGRETWGWGPAEFTSAGAGTVPPMTGVDVLGGDDDGVRGDFGEACHARDFPVDQTAVSERTSVTLPVTAEAAAVSGEARNVRPPLP